MKDLKTIFDKKELTKKDIIFLLSLNDNDSIEYLRQTAFDLTTNLLGNKVFYRGIIEFSNICTLDCNYCGIRKSNSSVQRYSLKESEIIDAALWCAKSDYGSIVLQSGERRDEAFIQSLEDIISKIKTKSRSSKLPNGLGITLSVGEQSLKTYKRLFEAGAHRYLLRIETTNNTLFNKLHPKEQSLKNRKESLTFLKEAGFQVGTGVMIGMPGQTIDMLADDILFFKEIDIDMIGMGPYIQSPNAPFAKLGMMEKEPLLQLALKMIATTRIVLQDVNIAATTALQAINPKGREIGITYGANVTMPNLTPQQVRANYQLYQGKPCLDEGRSDCKSCLKNRIESVNREVGFNMWGDSLNFTNRIKPR